MEKKRPHLGRRRTYTRENDDEDFVRSGCRARANGDGESGEEEEEGGRSGETEVKGKRDRRGGKPHTARARLVVLYRRAVGLSAINLR